MLREGIHYCSDQAVFFCHSSTAIRYPKSIHVRLPFVCTYIAHLAGRAQAGAPSRHPTLTIAAVGVFFDTISDAADGRWVDGAQAVLTAQTALFDIILVFAGCTSDAAEQAIAGVLAEASFGTRVRHTTRARSIVLRVLRLVF